LRAWCEALAQNGQWEQALHAYEQAAECVNDPVFWRGCFLDGAARVAWRLGRRDVPSRLEAAWMEEPTMERLLRWLGTGSPTRATVRKRANKALQCCDPAAGGQLGLLHLTLGRPCAAATLLGNAPGLGWSDEEHPGHLLFEVFAELLIERLQQRPEGGPLTRLFAGFDELYDLEFAADDLDTGLATPTAKNLITWVAPANRLKPAERGAMLDAMKLAAERRVEEVTRHKRRRHYEHAAVLVACCVDLAPAAPTQEPISEWLEYIRWEYRRFYAFRRELDAALEGPSGDRAPRSEPSTRPRRATSSVISRRP
jgi:hypothetical protein